MRVSKRKRIRIFSPAYLIFFGRIFRTRKRRYDANCFVGIPIDELHACESGEFEAEDVFPIGGSILRPIGPCSSILFYAVIRRAFVKGDRCAAIVIWRECPPRANRTKSDSRKACRRSRSEHSHVAKNRSRRTKRSDHNSVAHPTRSGLFMGKIDADPSVIRGPSRFLPVAVRQPLNDFATLGSIPKGVTSVRGANFKN
jgi:hypothetical protein